MCVMHTHAWFIPCLSACLLLMCQFSKLYVLGTHIPIVASTRGMYCMYCIGCCTIQYIHLFTRRYHLIFLVCI
ncbi:hypothetical protein F4810DRAFT_677714 [Camillea tinctor]|nr:hypothetical protein F4810DRAFT_677714 [Camillea tinctor]